MKLCLVRIYGHFNIHIHYKYGNNEIFIPNEYERQKVKHRTKNLKHGYTIGMFENL